MTTKLDYGECEAKQRDGVHSYIVEKIPKEIDILHEKIDILEKRLEDVLSLAGPESNDKAISPEGSPRSYYYNRLESHVESLRYLSGRITDIIDRIDL